MYLTSKRIASLINKSINRSDNDGSTQYVNLHFQPESNVLTNSNFSLNEFPIKCHCRNEVTCRLFTFDWNIFYVANRGTSISQIDFPGFFFLF